MVARVASHDGVFPRSEGAIAILSGPEVRLGRRPPVRASMSIEIFLEEALEPPMEPEPGASPRLRTLDARFVELR